MPDEEADATALPTSITPEDVVAAALRPAKATGDSGSIEERSVDDLIKAANYAAGLNARRGFRLSKIVPGGTP